MKMYQHVLSFMAGSLLLATQGFAGAYLYEINNFPRTNQPCQTHAQALADRLATITNVKIARAYCGAGNSSTYDLNVVYEATQALTTLDSMNHNILDAGIGQGMYKTLTECQQDLIHQQDEFAAMTGSSILSYFCGKDRFTSSYPYFPVIHAVITDGQAHPRLMFVTKQIFGRKPTDADTVAKAFEDKLRAKGVHVRKVILANEPADARLQVSYYGTEELRFYLKNNVAFEDVAACQTRAPSILAAFEKAGVPLYGSFCSPDEYSQSTKFFTIEALTLKDIIWTVVPGVYPSRQACEADLKHMEDVYSTQVAIAGSVCVYHQSFQAVILGTT